MAYEGNGGDYVSYAEDENDYTKQRKVGGPLSAAGGTHNGGDMMSPSDCNHLNEKANEYVRDCANEKSRMDRKFPIAEKLLDNGKYFGCFITLANIKTCKTCF